MAASEKVQSQADTKLDSTNLVNNLSNDYAKYLEVDISTENEEFGEGLEEMLTRLDEYCGLVDLIRSDTSLCLNRTLPEIYKKAKEMEKIFERVDQLEAYVAMVKKTMGDMEKEIEKAEAEMGTLSTFKKMFGSFSLPGLFGSKTPQAKEMSVRGGAPPASFIPPPIFSTEKYISYGRALPRNPGHGRALPRNPAHGRALPRDPGVVTSTPHPETEGTQSPPAPLGGAVGAPQTHSAGDVGSASSDSVGSDSGVNVSTPSDKDLSPGDKDLSSGDKDLSPGDKDMSPGDNDSSPGDKDLSSGDQDLSPGEGAHPSTS